MVSELTMSDGLERSGFFSRFERITSTRSFGRMKPPAPVSGEISVEIARMPVGRIAAMKPEPLALTSFGSRFGRKRFVASCTRKICGNAAGTERDGQDDDPCGIHTLHYLRLRGNA